MSNCCDNVKFEELLGKTLAAVTGAARGSSEIIFITSDGEEYTMNHTQDCCESVNVEDVCGDLNDILNCPLLQAEEVTSNDKFQTQDGYCQDDSWTWTFYRLTTQRGQVVIRWLGESNGYYSESVDFCRTKEKPVAVILPSEPRSQLKRHPWETQ